MTLSTGKEAVQRFLNADPNPYLSPMPAGGSLESTEQIRRFELLRLAFFVLKLRKVEQKLSARRTDGVNDDEQKSQENELEFRCNLLRHVIYQQVIALIRLDAREQALQIIEVCRK
jgi:hypothetical protein